MCINFFQSVKIHESCTHRPAAYSLSHILPQIFSVSSRYTVSYCLALSPTRCLFSLYPNGWEILMRFLFLAHFLFSFPSSLLVLGRGKLLLIPEDILSVVNSMLWPATLPSATPQSHRGKHLSWDLIWNCYSRKGRLSPSYPKMLIRGTTPLRETVRLFSALARKSFFWLETRVASSSAMKKK